jgi:hypothetical protein
MTHRRLAKAPTPVWVAVRQDVCRIEARVRKPMPRVICALVANFTRDVPFRDFREEVEFAADAISSEHRLRIEPDPDRAVVWGEAA